MVARPNRWIHVIARCLSSLSVAGIAWAVALPLSAAEPAVPAARSLERLLVDSPFMFHKLENGMYRLAVNQGEHVSTILVDEVTMDWKDARGQEVKRILIYRWIADVPEGFTASPALLAKILELNLQCHVGRIDLNKQGLFFTSGLWLRTADAQALSDEVQLALDTGAQALPSLEPLLQPAKVAQQPAGAP